MGAHERPFDGGPGAEEHPQTRITFVALFTLLQTILMASGAAVGLISFPCSSPIKSDSITWKSVDFYYFRGNCYSSYTVNQTSYTIQGINEASKRTEIILWVYIGLIICWFIGSVLLLVSAAKGKHIKPNKGKYLHFIWIITTILMLTYDGITTIIYLVDLTFISSEDGLQNFLYIFPMKTLDFNENLPPIIMAVIFSKGVVLWFVDGILIFVIWKQFKILQEMRLHNQWVQANLSTTPTYLLPPQLQQHSKANLGINNPVPTLPRLMNVNGKFVGSNQSDIGNTLTNNRPSALQKAARQGFNYEDPSSRPWSTPAENSISPTTPTSFNFQGFSYGGAPPTNYGQQGGYPQDPNDLYNGIRNTTTNRNRDRPASLQQGPEVFY